MQEISFYEVIHHFLQSLCSYHVHLMCQGELLTIQVLQHAMFQLLEYLCEAVCNFTEKVCK